MRRSSACRRSAPWPCSGPGCPAYAEGLAAVAGLEVSPLDGDRWLVRARDHGSCATAWPPCPGRPERLRVEVDPTDV